MDVLYFIKEEYEVIKNSIPQLIGGDINVMSEESLHGFLRHAELLVRVADELILPELADSAKRGLEALAEAGNQSSELAKIIGSGLKSGRLAEARKRDLSARLVNHIEYMEQVILPKFRVEISTQTREDLGLVASDFKADTQSVGGRRFERLERISQA